MLEFGISLFAKIQVLNKTQATFNFNIVLNSEYGKNMENAKILIVEDNFITLSEIEIRVQELGYTNTETAMSGDEAIEKAISFMPNLILTDINLGIGITGIEAVRRIRESIDVPVVYLTAYDDEETFKEANINEPYAYLVKPLQERDLRIALSIALYKHKTEKELKELIATKNKLFSIIAHDLKSPFTSILGFSELLMKKHKSIDQDKRESFISNILTSARNTFTLLENLLTWTRSQSGQIQLNPEKINLDSLIKQSVSILQNTAENKNIKISLPHDHNLFAYADNNTVATVLRNFLSNALKFTPRNGKIEIFAEEIQNNSSIKISIKDNGVGMSSKKIESLFSIETNESTQGTEQENGTGIGLLICREFIQLNKGKILVESKVNEGSIFSFILPKYQE